MESAVYDVVNDLRQEFSRHYENMDKRLNTVDVGLSKIQSLATDAKHAAERAEAQATATNGRVRALELWKAALEGAGKAMNIQFGFLFGSGVLLAVALFVAGRAWS